MPDSLTPTSFSRADELNVIGAKFHTEKGNIELARLHYLAALKHDPDHPGALQNLSAALITMDKLEAAASVARRATRAAPNNWFAWGNLAVALLGLRQYEAAIEIFDRVIDKMPKENMGAPMHNFGLAHHMLMNYDQAMKCYNRSLALIPDLTPAKSDRALCMLAQGRIIEGLKEYEIRWNILAKSRVWEFGIPEWQGENLSGKRILLHHEQGLGDTLMLCRFIKQIKDLGANVTYAGPGSFNRIITDSFDVKFLDWNDDEKIKAESFDYHAPMLSLMRWLRLRVGDISSEPYLKARPWEIPLKLPSEFKVGICWQSGDHGAHMEKRRRKVPMELLIPLSEIPGIKLVSLNKLGDPKPGQTNATRDDIVDFGLEGIIFDCMSRVEDFADTAVLANQLDLIISVDSAVVHLAGAIGKPTVMLSPYTRCWRWWNANNEGNWSGEPWYRNMKIIPQSQDGSWDAAIEQTVEYIDHFKKGL